MRRFLQFVGVILLCLIFMGAVGCAFYVVFSGDNLYGHYFIR